jgi:hypothetical protein
VRVPATAARIRGVPTVAAPSVNRDVRRAQVEEQRVALVGKVLTAVALTSFGITVTGGFDTAVYVLSLAALAAVVGMLWSPPVGLLGVTLMCTLESPMRAYLFEQMGLRYNSFNYLMLAVAAIGFPAVWAFRDIHTRLLAAFGVVLALQLLPSPNLTGGIVTMLEIIAVFALIGVYLRGLVHRNVLYWTAIVNATASAAVVFGYLYFPPPAPMNENALGQVIIGGLASMALAVSVRGTGGNWILPASLVTANVVAAFLTGSRGGFLLAIILGGYIMVMLPRVTAKMYLLLLALVVFGWSAARFSNQYSVTVEKWSRLLDPTADISYATSNRSDLAIVGWRLFLDKPMGNGTGAFSELDDYISVINLRRAAHSAWIKTLAENGIPGMVLLILYVSSFVWGRKTSAAPVSKWLGVLVATTLGTGFVFIEFQSKGLWMLAAGASVLLNGGALVAAPSAPTPAGLASRIRGYRAAVLRIPQGREAKK